MSKNIKSTILLWSNNEDLEEYLVKKSLSQIDYSRYKESSNGDYLHLIIDLDCNLETISSKIYSVYLSAKEKRVKTLFSLIFTAQTNSDILKKYKDLVEVIDGEIKKYRLLIAKDLYTLDESEPVTSLDKVVHGHLRSRSISITKKNQKVFAPLSIDDFVLFSTKTLFLASTEGKTYYLEGEELAESDYSYQLNTLASEAFDEDIDINTNKADSPFINNNPTESIRTQAELNLTTEVSFYDQLKSLVKNDLLFSKNKAQISESTKSKKSKIALFIDKLYSKKEKPKTDLKEVAVKKIEKIILAIALYASLIILVVSLIFVVSSYYSLKNLEKSLFYLKKGDMINSSKHLNLSTYAFNISSLNFSIVEPFLNLASRETAYTGHNYLSFVSFTKNTLESLVQSYGFIDKVYQSVNTPGDHNYQDLSLAIKSNLYQSYESLNQVEILLDKANLPKPVLQVVQQNIKYKGLKEIQNQIIDATKLIDLLPKLLGDDTNSNIFILIQNNHELRPTGGVIEHIYHLSIEEGRPIFQKNYSPLEIDQIDQFTLEAPPLVEEVTGNSVWSLKDMNYNPDFPQTAINIGWYLEKKLKIKPDLIIALNVSALENILNKKTPSVSSQINKSYEDYKTELLSSRSYESTKALFQNLLDLVFGHKLPLSELLQITAVGGEDYLVWSSDNSLQKQLLSQKYSGSIYSHECHQGMTSARKCLKETTHLNFANFSSIPLNDYLQRTVEHNITPEVLGVNHEVLVSTSYTREPPLVNRNLIELVQLYLPKESVITGIKNNDTDINLATMIAQEHQGLTRYQFTISNTLGKSYKVKISYTTQLPERTILPTAYSQSIIPQSGDPIAEYRLSVNLPEQSRVSAITAEVDSLPNKISLNLSGIKTFGFHLVPK